MVEVVTTDEFAGWYQALDEKDGTAVFHVVGLLAAMGVGLRHPYSSQTKGASFALRELRAQSGGRPLRVFYAFDPSRDAVLIIGGDKTGDDRFYETMIPIAEKIWETCIEEH